MGRQVRLFPHFFLFNRKENIEYMAKVNEIIDLAQSQVGTKESPSNSNNVKYNTWYYGKAVSGSSYPWCAVFISWLFNQIDNSLIKKSASCMTIGQWFKDNNMWFTAPKVGDVVFFKFNTNNIAKFETVTSLITFNK